MDASELVGSFATVYILGWALGVKLLAFKRFLDSAI